MPKASTIQSNFNAGELSPLIYGRTDSPRYKQGLATCQNYIPTLQGPLVRRPGTKFLNAVKDSTKPPVLIPFQYSITQAYVLEFGDAYIRFYANNGQVVWTNNGYKVTGIYGSGQTFYATRANTNPGLTEQISSSSSVSSGAVLELTSPYAYTDVQNIKYTQNANVIYLFHPSYPVYKLQFNGPNYWTLNQVNFQDGPYLALNSYSTFADNTNVVVNIPYSTSVSATVVTQAFTINAAYTDPGGSGQIQINTTTAHGMVNGQKVYVSGIVGTTEANNRTIVLNPTHPYYWSVQVVSSTALLLLGSTFTNAYSSGGTVQAALFWANMGASPQPDHLRVMAIYSGGQRYWGYLAVEILGSSNTFTSSAQATLYVPNNVTIPTGNATAWQLGVYSNGNGFPSCGTFHQNRLVMAGCPNTPQQVDFSSIYSGAASTVPNGGYETFSASVPSTLQVPDNAAMQFTLNSSDVNAIRWLKSTAQALLAGSYTAEWAMTPSSNSEALTPSNFNAAQTSFFGSANVDAVGMGNAVLYIQRAQRKVRELNYYFQVGTFRSTDMTELSEHITLPSITKLVVQKETQPLLWAIRSDGALISMIYNRDDVSLQAGWTRHFLGGQSDASGTPPVVVSLAVIPSTDLSFDQVWSIVKRYINGSYIYCIEYMTKIFDDLALQEDAFQLDCGGTYDVPVTITGISNANPCVVTAPAHGFSNGKRIRIVGVNGLGAKSVDVNGNVTYSNLVNENTFVVAGVTTNTFQLNDFAGNAIDSTNFSAYISGGQVRALVTTISGLTWLEGETVSVLADGGLHPNVTVSNTGSITLQFAAAKVQIGYSFNSDGQMMRIEGGAADGTSIGKTRRTSRVAIMMHKIGDLMVGTSFSNLIPLKFSRADVQQSDQATPLYSGLEREGLESAYDFESQICFRQNSALPGMVQAITSFMEEWDV